MASVFFLVFFLFLRGAVGELVCEELPVELCSYSIDSSGKRCVLETFSGFEGTTNLQCKTSEVMVNSMNEHIESDQCITACGLERLSVGISSDSLAEPKSVRSLCSADCRQNCPNILDLFDNLALAEGASLRDRCKIQKQRSQTAAAARSAVTRPLKTSGAASGPVSAAEPPFAAADPPFAAADPPIAEAEPPVSGGDSPLSAATPGQF